MHIRKDFPFFRERPDTVFFDNAATTHKPASVIEAIAHFYAHDNAPVHRGIYQLAEQATEKFEAVRAKVASFIGARHAQEIVFTKGATEGINIIAWAWAEKALGPQDEIITSVLEHHAHLVVWQQVAYKTGARLRFVPLTADGDLDYEAFASMVTDKTKLIAVSARSNVTGLAFDLSFIMAQAQRVGARVSIDASQAIVREALAVADLGCDFLVFSGHKMLGPTGIGVLYVNHRLHEDITPWHVGGGMVHHVKRERAQWREMPYRCEAGTPPIAQAIGLGAAIDYIETHVDRQLLHKHEAYLCRALVSFCDTQEKIGVLGARDTLVTDGHLVTMVLDGVSSYDIAAFLDQYGLCVRAGHHCAQPLHTHFGVSDSLRVSFFGYNTHDEVTQFIDAFSMFLETEYLVLKKG